MSPNPNTTFTSKRFPLSTFLFLIILLLIGFYTLRFPPTKSKNTLLFHQLFLSSATNYTLSSYLRSLTSHPHLAGTIPSLQTIRYVQTHFQNLGFQTHTVPFRTLLSYPLHASVSMHFGNATLLNLPLNEIGITNYDASSGLIQPYHAFSPSGTAMGRVVFANHGTEDDYGALGRMGVNVSGCIVMVKKGGGLGRGAVVEIAEKMGALGVLMYAEGDVSRGSFGFGVERGTVMKGVGDPLTPGWAGVEDGERLDLEDNKVSERFPGIPSLPLPFKTAQLILESLGGPLAPQEWRDSGRSNLSRVGPGPGMVNFTYQGEKKLATIYNVFAVIRGLEEPDRYVLMGNHRDAWTYGAVDPNSGTAALLDIARRYALLMRKGWNPRRTIIFCSWDAEEFGMIGSTEWVEQNLVNLGAKAVAYLNVDCAVQGPGFFAGATPQLDNLIFEVTKKVKDPDSEVATIYDKWKTMNGKNNIERLTGVDSDFAPFLQHAGVPSVDIYYGRDFPVYHTAFDSFNWMINYADPFFWRHVAVAGVWGLLGLHLADDPILPLDYLSYAKQLQGYKDTLSRVLDASISLAPLAASIQELTSAAEQANNETKNLVAPEFTDDLLALKIRALNDRLMLAERGFLDTDGIKGKEWFKHLIYGPRSNHRSEFDFFPGISDAIAESTRMSGRDRDATIQHEIWRVARAIQRAAAALRGEVI
ncbi:ALTERED MERISTEM PROGRAM 1, CONSTITUTIVE MORPHOGENESIS 2, PRIMORDIA TIMING, Multifolia, HAUPTLING [Hibiscus trionum]|uniref:glutamate carboxypeptidase II n=1 Tax=Hibiscus trionum TaxID=183268 RepID=A0A9W7MV52_HIBTR|nr:ALTERED MERISTEM PROGRAM 1, CONSTITUTIVE MORPHOGENESIS 2, PRIMORDIA TIMING, Multifolia, HAUPTLING [Hibiscus trionum]